MIRFLKWLILLPVGAVVIGLAVLNRGTVKLVYWPQQFGGELAVSLPLFVVLLLALMLGVVIGGIASWLAQSRHRRAERRYRAEAERLKSEAERLKSMQPAVGNGLLPALPSR